MAINVALETFEGPLDLLLQLVRRSQISVWEIRIQSICEQFIEYTRQLEKIDVEQAGDFMVMASTLIRIKARLLLPRPENEPPAEESIDEEEALITRLLLYEGFKEAAEELERMAETSMVLYPRGYMEELGPRPVDDPLQGVSLLTLAVMAQEACKSIERPDIITVETESYTVGEQMAYIEHRLTDRQEVLSFEELLTSQASREEIVTTFLAVLELVRLQRIIVWQENHLSPVLIARRVVHAAI
ncbi:MAG: segregation/condensation protein A [Firmicutes bacterium]|nr:segregation/condensation protein A [Bacillota bacterium]